VQYQLLIQFEAQYRKAMKDLLTLHKAVSRGKAWRNGKKLSAIAPKMSGNTGKRMPKQRDIIIVYGMSQGWSTDTAAAMHAMSKITVLRHRQCYTDDPSLLFNSPIMDQRRI